MLSILLFLSHTFLVMKKKNNLDSWCLLKLSDIFSLQKKKDKINRNGKFQPYLNPG